MNLPHTALSCLTIGAALAFSGCTTSPLSTTERTGIQQLLLSQSVDEALADVSIPQVDGKKTFVHDVFLEIYDKPYVMGSIRALLSENGALLVSSMDEAEIVVEPRSGALGIDFSESLLGVPSVPFIIPGAGGITTPELTLYASQKSDGVSKLALLAYDPRDGSQVFSTDSLVGKSHFHSFHVLLFITLNFTDIPERERY